MKVDFKKLRKVEAEYRNDKIALKTLQTMISVVLNSEAVPQSSRLIAITTLIELGVLIETLSVKDPEHLNS